MTRALLVAGLLAAFAGVAAAHPIDDDDWWHDRPPPPPPVQIVETPPPPPAPPVEPRQRSLGFRFGMGGMQVAGHDRMIGAMGLQYGLKLAGELRGFTDYELLIIFSGGDAGDPDAPKIWGRGHALRVGLRYPLADHTFNAGHSDGALRFYVDAEASAGGAYTSDNELGARLTPQATGGLRLGYEMLKRDDDYDHPHAPLESFDAHVVFRAIATPGDVSFLFGVGMEWGS